MFAALHGLVCVAVVRFQGPKAHGMPELHKLMPYLGLLQDRGFNVALVTDGCMSGASGKILAPRYSKYNVAVSSEIERGRAFRYRYFC